MAMDRYDASPDARSIYTQVDMHLSETRALVPCLPGLGIEELRAILSDLQRLTDLACGTAAEATATLASPEHGALL